MTLNSHVMKTLPLLLLLLVSAAPGAGQTFNPTSQEALDATLRMLRDPGLHGPVVSRNPQASGIDTQVQALVGGSPQLEQEVYELAAQIFSELSQTTGGDVAKMQETLERAMISRHGWKRSNTRCS